MLLFCFKYRANSRGSSGACYHRTGTVPLSPLLCLQHTEVNSQLLEKDERKHGVRPEPDEAGYESLEKAHRSEPADVAQDRPDTAKLARLRIHHHRLDHVDRLRHRGRNAARNDRGQEMRTDVVGKVARLEQRVLCLVVER